MKRIKYIEAGVFALSLGALALVTVSPTLAMPGWSNSDGSEDSIKSEQREQISALHSAYRAALAELDWSVGENGHAPETMLQARQLQLALRAEIFDVIHRDRKAANSSRDGACPYSGQPKPVKVDGSTRTLYL